MPAPGDVQTTDGGGQAGRVQQGDQIAFTYAGAVNPALVLSGWDGSATPVTVQISDNGANDIFFVRNASSGAVLVELGLVQLSGNYVTSDMTFTGSSMTLSGDTITIVLGTASGAAHTVTTPTTMIWSTFHGTATESGADDVDF